jgi:hypothetical protein
MISALDALRDYIDRGFPDSYAYRGRPYLAAGFLQRMLRDLPVEYLPDRHRDAVRRQVDPVEPVALCTYHDAAVALVLAGVNA